MKEIFDVMNGPRGPTVPTRYWHELADGRLQCDMCPRYCKLREGQRGMCFVRMRQDDGVVLTTYGRSSGFCIDPIEKKPLNHFFPGTPVLSFGTAGCNLACKFCQNWDISKSREMDRLADAASPEGLAEAAERLGCRSVAFTYNDPVIFHEYAIDVAQACRERGIGTVAVTAGYVCDEPRREFYKHMDAANVDLKAFTEDFYWELTKGHMQPVLDTLVYLKHETDVWFEITTLLIPGKNDSDGEIDELSAWVAARLGPDVPVHFTAFHPDWKMMDLPATPPVTLRRAREIALRNGIRYVYTGNVHDIEGGSTVCHGCGGTLIARDWYVLKAWNLSDDGRCADCGTPCAGVFDGPPGDWGSRRLPVRIGR
jgi:pyruvate formate lyase activating enzyme